jgi:glycine/serine hydroxymethyltransferase
VSATKAPGNDKPVDVLRLGTQELVRRGLRARDMNQVADVMTRITVDHENPEVAGSTVEAIRASVARDAVAS